ncbi:MAG: tetratricopeptide repeat protein [Gemmataceae bacterium]|nr:tetratricopeptide repeat protein [Gemmataceae bacterium]
MRWAVAMVVFVLAGAPAARAQLIYAPVYGPGFGGGFAYRNGFSFGGPGFRTYGFSHGFYAAPVVPYWIPIAGPGWGPGYGNPFFLSPPAGLAPPVEATPPPIGLGNPDPNPGPAAPAAPSRPPAGDYIVISPRKASAEGTITPKIDRVAPPPDRSRPPVPRIDPFGPQPVLGKTDKPEADPVAEAARLVKQARDAFAAGEYGQAVEHLDRAIGAKPGDSFPYFLRAQGQFAAGQYAEAVASIREGMKLAPGWPASGFKPKDLYGDKPERFDAQLAALRKALAANPAEPALQFLLGYELWFSGDRPAAVALFRDAAKQLSDTAIVDRFLREAEGK